MAQFIELHCKHNGNPLYINVDSIAFIENENGRVYINFLMQRISASGNSNVSSYVYREEVTETYLQVKSKIEE
jgi:hypothetical protein|nr:hypothetical protein [uncultured Prevotella sp.]